MTVFQSILFVLVGLIIYLIIEDKKSKKIHQKFLDELTPEGRIAYDNKVEKERLEVEKEILEERLKKEEKLFFEINGKINPELICPHCQNKGFVYSKEYSFNKTVKGKVGGILKTDIKINQNESGTMRFCKNCESRWNI